MNRENITEIVFCVVKDVLGKLDGIESITPQTNLSDFGADSLDLLEIIVGIENKYNIYVSDSDADVLCSDATVENFVNYIMKSL